LARGDRDNKIPEGGRNKNRPGSGGGRELGPEVSFTKMLGGGGYKMLENGWGKKKLVRGTKALPKCHKCKDTQLGEK